MAVSLQAQRWKQLEDSAEKYGVLRDTVKYIAFKIKANWLLKKDSAGTLTYSRSCRLIGLYYDDLPHHNKAMMMFYYAMDAAEKAEGKKMDYADNAMRLALVRMKDGSRGIGLYLFKEAMEAYERASGKSLYWVSAGTYLAWTYWKEGDYPHALKTYNDILPYAGTTSNPPKVIAYIHAGMGGVFMDMGEMDKAGPLLILAQDEIKQIIGAGTEDYAISTAALGEFYLLQGDYQRAEDLLTQAFSLRGSLFGKLSLPWLESVNSMADLYTALGQYDRAYALLDPSRDTLVKLGLDKNPLFYPVFADCLEKLGSLEEHAGNIDSAIVRFSQAKQINADLFGKITPQWLNCSAALGNLLSKKGNRREAQDLLLQVMNRREAFAGKNNIDYANALSSLGLFNARYKQFKFAETNLLEANQLYRSLAGDHILYEQSCRNIQQLYWKTGRYTLASKYMDTALITRKKILERIFRFSTEKQKEEYLENVASTSDDDQSFYYNISPMKAGAAYNLALANRNLILNSTSALRQKLNNITDTSTRKLYEQWTILKNELARQYSKPVSQRSAGLSGIEQKATEIEKQLSLKFSVDSLVGKETPQLISWKDIRAELKPGEAAIEFASFRYKKSGIETDSILYTAILLRDGFTEPISIALFEQKQFMRRLNLDNTDYTLARLYRDTVLYHLCWRPIEKYLKGIKKIYFAPSGSLYRIAFAAISINREELLSDRYELRQLNSTAAILHQAAARLAPGASVFLSGGIDYNADSAAADSNIPLMAMRSYTDVDGGHSILQFNPSRGGDWRLLPGTKREIDAIAKAAEYKGYTVTILEGRRATEENFKALAGPNSPAYIHVATHGFFFPDPPKIEMEENLGDVFMNSANPLLRSGLVFAGANNSWSGKRSATTDDGILTAYEISNLYFPATKLVVLSACETALGDIEGNEGVYGLQRAFNIAGVGNLVMSLWQVPDNETAEFMELFSKNLFAGLRIPDAFNRTQSAMKSRYRHDPYKWAAWILIR